MFLEGFKMSILICIGAGIGAILVLIAMKNFNTSFKKLSFIGKVYRIICVAVLIVIVSFIVFVIIKIIMFFVKLFLL